MLTIKPAVGGSLFFFLFHILRSQRHCFLFLTQHTSEHDWTAHVIMGLMASIKNLGLLDGYYTGMRGSA
jgi:hypothetical protein